MKAQGESVEGGRGPREKAGTLVVLADMWTSRELPALAAISRFRDAAAREYADASAAMMQGLAAAFAEDPRLRVAFKESGDQIRKMDGMAMKTTLSLVIVAPEQTQVTLMKVTSEVRNIRTQPLDASLFEAPADYRRVPSD